MKRTIIITGGNTGLGYSCARYIAGSSNDYTIMIACRNVQKGNDAAEKLKEKTGNPNIYVLELDLTSLASVRKFKIKTTGQKLYHRKCVQPRIYAGYRVA